jgi:hypothetical protein
MVVCQKAGSLIKYSKDPTITTIHLLGYFVDNMHWDAAHYPWMFLHTLQTVAPKISTNGGFTISAPNGVFRNPPIQKYPIYKLIHNVIVSVVSQQLAIKVGVLSMDPPGWKFVPKCVTKKQAKCIPLPAVMERTCFFIIEKS